MKIQRQRLIFSIFFFASIIISYLIWDSINLKFKNLDIIGEYSLNNYNAANDILRYFIFLILPCSVFIIYKYYSQKFFFTKINSFLINNEKTPPQNNKTLLFFFLLFLILIFFEFFSINLPTHKVDSYHDGQRLSSAYKFFTEGTLWSGSYITVGIFYETLSSSIFWNLFDHVSIGLARFADIVYIFIFKILFIFFIFLLAEATKLEIKKKIIFFVFNSIIFITLIDYDLSNVDNIGYRELPIISILISFTLLLNKTKNKINIFFISILSPISMFWGVDRGLVCNILILIIFGYLFLSKRKNEGLLLLLLISIFWFLSYLYLGNEFEYFLSNTFLVFKEMSYVHGLIHPKIFSDDLYSARATKTILIILANLIISINLLFKKKYSINFSKIIIFLSLISAGSYLYALGRSDGPHIKNSFGFPLITISLFFSYLILRKFTKKITYNKSKIISGLLVILFIFNIELNLKNILSYNKRLKDFIYLSDISFLSNGEKNFINFIKPKLVNHSCIQIFSNDAILNYLLRKKSCTKYYFVWSAASKSNQNQFIKELSDTDIIIEGGRKDSWDYPLKIKIHHVFKHIVKNYELIDSFDNWNIFVRK